MNRDPIRKSEHRGFLLAGVLSVSLAFAAANLGGDNPLSCEEKSDSPVSYAVCPVQELGGAVVHTVFDALSYELSSGATP